MKTYREILIAPPETVAWTDVVDFDRLDERLSCIDCLFVNILSVSEDHVEWCPNDDPPSKSETLAWLWFIRPDLGCEIANDAPEELRKLIEKWQSGDMESWWKEISE